MANLLCTQRSVHISYSREVQVPMYLCKRLLVTIRDRSRTAELRPRSTPGKARAGCCSRKIYWTFFNSAKKSACLEA
jgi:hypothetical protein